METLINQSATKALFTDLALLFEAEGRPGGDVAAEALRRHGGDPAVLSGKRTVLSDLVAELLTRPGAMAAAVSAAAIMDQMPWHHSGLEDGRIRPDVALDMITCELLGPTGMILAEGCRVGLFAQRPGQVYPSRHHAAEETFVMLSGTASWQAGDGSWWDAGPGDQIHHTSMISHRSNAGPEGFVAAWRWTGDIGRESYLLTG
ncbi:MAG: dimethylsulfonioproprionate lyase family protein [Pseudomonadota bacterium]